jgi:hypothetical protein
MVAVDGLLEPEAGATVLAALEPLARPGTADDERSAGQRRADALAELARRNLESGRLPQTGGARPQLLATVDLDTLRNRPWAVLPVSRWMWVAAAGSSRPPGAAAWPSATVAVCSPTVTGPWPGVKAIT